MQIVQRELKRVCSDSFNFQRGWGWYILPVHDDAFSNKEYIEGSLHNLLCCIIHSFIIELHSLRGANGLGEFVTEPDLVDLYASPNKSILSLLDRFINIWKLVAPSNTTPVMFTNGGSDANNLLFMFAKAASIARHKTSASTEKLCRPRILWFSGIYGASRGDFAACSFLKQAFNMLEIEDLNEFQIPSPHTHYSFDENIDDVEKNRLEKCEKVALSMIELLAGKDCNIGGVFLEAILGPFGVFFFRQVFLQQLRVLCDQLGLLVFCDEVLTGGGRTGKFFGYEHYTNFEPDYITFGKGLLVAGVARVERAKRNITEPFLDGATSIADPFQILRSIQVLQTIKERNLIENAQISGRQLLAKLRKLENNSSIKVTPDKQTRGIGLLLFTKLKLNVKVATGGRMMPMLTLGSAEIEGVQLNEDFPDSDDFCSICHEEGFLLLCDGQCNKAYHPNCLGMKLAGIPKNDWFCSKECQQHRFPKDNPSHDDFNLTLFNKNPKMFKVAGSSAGNESGLGLWFRGNCKAGELLVGFGGKLGLYTNTRSCMYTILFFVNILIVVASYIVYKKNSYSKLAYAARLGISQWALDATQIREQNNFTKNPLGHMINRPNNMKKQTKNCEFYYNKKAGLLYIRSIRAINTGSSWIELFIVYNDVKI